MTLIIVVQCSIDMQVQPKCHCTVHTSHWNSEHRTFSTVGEYHSEDLMLDSELFPNKAHGLNGRHILIGTNYVSVMFPAVTDS